MAGVITTPLAIRTKIGMVIKPAAREEKSSLWQSFGKLRGALFEADEDKHRHAELRRSIFTAHRKPFGKLSSKGGPSCP